MLILHKYICYLHQYFLRLVLNVSTSLCFKIVLKSFVVSQVLSSGFKEFQIVAILNLKDRCPVAVLYKGVSIILEFLVTRDEMSSRLSNCNKCLKPFQITLKTAKFD
jgi:hypothetical protein